MFITIPLILILVSVGGIFVIVWRRMPQLKKVTNSESESGERTINRGGSGDNLFSEFFPEVIDTFKKIKFKEFKDMWLIELEKLLRRLRIVSLKIDRTSDSLIKKIKRINVIENQNQQDQQDQNKIIGDFVATPVSNVSEVKTKKKQVKKQIKKQETVINTSDQLSSLKIDEQKLIIQIAKTPKDAKLYEKLGDLYVVMNNKIDAINSYDAAIRLKPRSKILKSKRSGVVM